MESIQPSKKVMSLITNKMQLNTLLIHLAAALTFVASNKLEADQVKVLKALPHSRIVSAEAASKGAGPPLTPFSFPPLLIHTLSLFHLTSNQICKSGKMPNG